MPTTVESKKERVSWKVLVYIKDMTIHDDKKGEDVTRESEVYVVVISLPGDGGKKRKR